LSVHLDYMLEDSPTKIQFTLFEVEKLIESEHFKPLPCHVYDWNNYLDAFRFMQSGKHMGKIVLSHTSPIHTEHIILQTKLFSTQATTIVTGAFGALGLKCIEWLVARGATHLLLLSRSGPKEKQALRVLEQIKAIGTKIEIIQGDIAQTSVIEKSTRESENTRLATCKGYIPFSYDFKRFYVTKYVNR